MATEQRYIVEFDDVLMNAWSVLDTVIGKYVNSSGRASCEPCETRKDADRRARELNERYPDGASGAELDR